MIKVHDCYRPLYEDKKHPIILITGGRGSGKSFSASTFINDLTFEYSKRYKKPHNILFTRYTMVSAGISIIPEVVDKINTDGLGAFFRQTKTDIVNRMTGARIMFRGIHTSSGNQTAKLKSIAGVTTFVVDEAEEWVSYDEFEKIFLSMRQKGLQIRAIIIMNPSDSNHWVYEKYIKDTHKIVEFDGVPVQISTHPDVLHIHTTYLDNRQYLSDTFIHQVEQMKESDPERYAHIVMGRWSDVAEGAVFKKWGIVEEFPEYARKIARAVDFGYTNDVTCIVRCGVVDNRLYIDELCYKTYMTSGDLIREFKAEEERGEDGFIYSESADPRLVDEIAMGGVIIKPVAKGGGSIEAGLSKMLSMEVFVTKRSVHAQEEFRNYVYDKDKDGHYLNVPVDKWNHCFVGESQILTKDGNKRLDDVCVGDYVATSKGYKKVEKVFNNGYKKILHTVLNFGDFTVEVKGTPDHKVKTNLGWIELQNLKPGMILFLFVQNGAVEFIPTTLMGVEVLDSSIEQVYDLQVEDVHEYSVNGVLVHNCIDASRYYVLGNIMGKLIKPKAVSKADLGLV